MSRFCLGLALWTLLLAFAACGGDSKGTDPKDAELAEMVDTVVSTYDDLTVCTDKLEGATAYVEDEKKAYVCESKRWTANDSLTESILDKDSDSAKDAESGEKVDAVVPSFDDLPACTGDRNGKTAYVEDEDSAYVCKKGLWVVDDSLTKAVQSKDENTFPEAIIPSSCKEDTDINCFLDERDDQIYRTVQIGDQVWMAQNLNYAGGGSLCFNDSLENCTKYGRLYMWGDAMSACPEGWHVPDTTEWNELITAVGGEAIAGIMLKSTEGWFYKANGVNGNGLDPFGFSALPAGIRSFYGYKYSGNYYEGGIVSFWSSTRSSNYAYYMGLGYANDNGVLSNADFHNAFSVRCLRDYKSSSSDKNSSSSSVVSTVLLALPCKTKTEDNCEYGTLTDDRDGLTYKIVKIGEQWWMAEDLNYRYIQQTAEEDSSSYCYGNASANCEEYGRLYPWSVAMGICPEGWHLPDTTEWNTLFTAVGGEASAGILLKAKDGWNSSWKNNGYGSDYFGFSALPAGYRTDGGVYYASDNSAGFWTSTEYASNRAYYMYLYYDYDSGKLNDDPKDYAYSVRCLKD
ncbi:MAG: fibrobacter succinogenes major paralogous domain-containing protein [Fibrobacter sp.]|nr:fibrobacter succinogenes major paralogous domain-containing protein [Fibrobacter sp.]